MRVFATFECEDCGSSYLANIHEEPQICFKCNQVHIYCPACTAVHALSYAQQDHYLNRLVN